MHLNPNRWTKGEKARLRVGGTWRELEKEDRGSEEEWREGGREAGSEGGREGLSKGRATDGERLRETMTRPTDAQKPAVCRV